MNLKTFTFSMVMAAMAASAFAQAPSMTAPKPMVDPSLVGSCFSDVYEKTFDLVPADGKYKAEFSTVEIAPGDNVLKMDNFTYAHLSLTDAALSGTVDVSGYDRLHFDIYKPANSTFANSIQPGLYGASATAYSGDQALTPGQWVSVDLQISDFNNAGLNAVYTFLLKDKSNSTAGTLYLDNVYFYKGDKVAPGDSEEAYPDETEEPDVTDGPLVFSILSAPVPENDPATVKSVYSDAYEPFCEITFDGGNGTLIFDEIEMNDGDNMYKMENFNYAKFSIGTVDVSDMDYLHFDVAVPASAVGKPIPQIQPVLVNDGVSQYTGTYTLEPGKWNSINVKMADFTAKGLDATKLTEIRFKHNKTAADDGDVIFDNIYFAKEAGFDGTTDNNWSYIADGPSGIDSLESSEKAQIVNDGKIYNMMGVEVNENYKGLVIKNGKKYIQK